MRSFIVSCDFRGRADIESAASGFLNKYNGIRIKRDTWFILSDDSSENLYEKLHEAVPAMYIFLAELTEGFKMAQPQPVTSWFKKNTGV